MNLSEYKNGLCELFSLSARTISCQELVDKPFKEVVQSKTEYAPRPSPCSLGRTSETHGNLGQFSRRTDSVLVLLRPTPSKLKLCSRSIVLKVSIAFYHFDFISFFFLTNHQFYCSVFIYCFSDRLFVSFVFLYRLAY